MGAGGGWAEREYQDGFALATAMPGPLAFQLGIYAGWKKRGIPGGLVAGLGFLLPPSLICLALGMAYVRFEDAAWLRKLFTGVSPVVIALIVDASLRMRKTILGAGPNRPALWGLAIGGVLVTALAEREVAWIFLVAAFVGALMIRERPVARGALAAIAALPLPAAIPLIQAPSLAALGGLFLKAALLVFGSGLVIVPILHGSLVRELHWMTERRFLDSVAVGIITPGPVMVKATFAGYLIHGHAGAWVATAAIFAPSFLCVFLGAPLLARFGDRPAVRGALLGINAAVMGAIAGSAILLGRSALTGWFGIGLVVAAFLLAWRRVIPEPALVLGGAAAGFIFG